MKLNQKILDVLGRAATDHPFCLRLVKDPSRACRSYHLSEEDLDRLTRLLSEKPRPSCRKAGLASVACLSLAAVLLSTSLAFAAGPTESKAVHKAPHSSSQTPSVRDDGQHGDGGATVKRPAGSAVHKRTRMPDNSGMGLERPEAGPSLENDRDLPVDSVLRKRPGSPRD